jgi:hypothetical protein
MAKSSEAIRDDEREIETEAAFAGKGPMGGESEGQYTMEKPTKDRSQELAQKAADNAAGEGPLSGVEGEGSVEVY